MNKVMVGTQASQVYPFLEKMLDRQQEQGGIMKVMLERMNQAERNVKKVEENVEQKFALMTEMVQEVRDSVTLNDEEKFKIQSAVHSLSIELTKEYLAGEEVSRDEFSKLVGKFRRRIWKELKSTFEVARYSHIRRAEFEESMKFVNDMSMSAFINL
ncbi:ORF6C domain-containing protein [Brevibacillus laterosporus]|uniref:ORF6C domain-containing protein n=1 Tax=Brevibacillus laterosporus TaxID=1465 RepID=UPI000E6C4720|nr:ORF6C domain-containing protein [Brevibacillus laterosporus]AYB38523.1 hypothetical protein D5F52_09770 [Brevibacillus laterosporus]MBM7111466.1 ORF6C domain protein [Brevibacillus laterosporus]